MTFEKNKWYQADVVPEYDTKVLAYNTNGGMDVYFYWAVTWEDIVQHYGITHWMLLPEAPKI